MFHKKSKLQKETYNKEKLKPVIRSSICTGEKVAGFRNLKNGKFEEIMLIKDSRDMEEFLDRYDISAQDIKKEW